jgi:3-oxoacyl-[acyl-carrier protein] reductase
VAIVTGGGTGVGRAVSLRLASMGAATVVVNYSKSRQEAEQTAADLERYGCKGLPFQADIGQADEARRMVDTVRSLQGRIDVLVNNAGTTRFVPHADLNSLSDQMWSEILQVNLMGPFYCSRAAAPSLRETGGAIVNVTSIAGLRASGSSIPYSVSKAALIQLTRNLASALAPEVRVNAVAPGLVSSRWYRAAFGEEVAREQELSRAASTPLNSVATPDQIAQAVVAMIDCDFVTGECLVVDGGRSISY